MKEQQAKQLLQLVREHKEKCTDVDCGVSLFLMLEIYEGLVGRKVLPEEQHYFY